MTHGCGFQALGDGVAGEKSGADQDARVGGVGARGDGGDDDVAVAEVEGFAGDGVALGGFAGLFVFGLKCCEEPGLCGAERDAAFGRLGPASEGSTSPRSRASVAVKTGSGEPASR